MSRTREYPRPLGVHGGPHPPDLAHAIEPADECLLNAVQLIRCAEMLDADEQEVTISAALDRIRMSLRALAARRLTARSATHPLPEIAS